MNRPPGIPKVALPLLALLAGTPMSCSQGRGAPDTGFSPPMVSFETPAGRASFEVEVVSSPAARETGLMHRRELPAGRGMLFVFDEDSDHHFWMKNTFIPLDMIFISGDGIVAGIVHNAAPHSLEARSVGRKSRYVLEISGGAAARLGIAEGQRSFFSRKPF